MDPSKRGTEVVWRLCLFERGYSVSERMVVLINKTTSQFLQSLSNPVFCRLKAWPVSADAHCIGCSRLGNGKRRCVSIERYCRLLEGHSCSPMIKILLFSVMFSFFFHLIDSQVLGMKVLRHEEFEKGCEAACNGPYDGRWSKTMVGYGPEDSHFVVELTYNYNIGQYKRGNDFQVLSLTCNIFSHQGL